MKHHVVLYLLFFTILIGERSSVEFSGKPYRSKNALVTCIVDYPKLCDCDEWLSGTFGR